jgi:hypothetical protein
VAIKKCKTDLFLKYEELALVTGSYPEFMRLAKKYTKRLMLSIQKDKKKPRKHKKHRPKSTNAINAEIYCNGSVHRCK